MADNMLSDDHCPKKLQISSQEDLLIIHLKMEALVSTLVSDADLSMDPKLHTYMCVVDDLLEQAINMNQKIISDMTKSE